MLEIYFVFLLIGFVGLLSSMVFGGDDGDLADGSMNAGDTFDDSPKVFSFRVIFSFLLAFGTGGGAVYYSEGSILNQILVGLAAGLCTGAFTWWITSILYKMQGASNVDSDSFMGMSGDIVVGTTSSGKSKVRLNTTSGPMEFLFKEADNRILKLGETVKVSEKAGTLLIVTKN